MEKKRYAKNYLTAVFTELKVEISDYNSCNFIIYKNLMSICTGSKYYFEVLTTSLPTNLNLDGPRLSSMEIH